MRFLLSTILFMALHSSAWSQNVITGRVLDSLTHQPIDCVSVILEKGEVSKATITDSTGIFSIAWADSLKPETVTFEHSVYKTKEIRIASNDLGVICLSSKSTELSEIVVKPNWIYRRDGNVIVDVTQIPGYDKLQTDKILKRLPGVVKKGRGSYTLNDKSAAIYINGVRQNISGASLESFLSSLPATAVSEVKLVNINSGEYPAGIEAVIDIKIDPHIPLGYSLQPSLSYTFSPHGLEDYGGTVFYMTKVRKMLFYNNLSVYDYRTRSESGDSLCYLGNKLFENEGRSTGDMAAITYQAQMTYTRDNDHTFGVNFFIDNDFSNSKSEWNPLNDKRLYRSKSRDDSWDGSIYYNIPVKYSKFNGTVQYEFLYGGIHSNNKYYKADYTTQYDNSDSDMEGWMHSLNLDFNSRWKVLKLSYGAQLNYNDIWDRIKYESSPENNSAPFRGYEILPSAYSTLRIKLSKSAAFRVGVRLEGTYYQYDTGEGKMKKHDLNLFPTLLFDLDRDSYYLTAGFSSDINYYTYKVMVPSIHKVNENYYTYGNPDLKPAKMYWLYIYNTFFKRFQANFTYTYTKDDGNDMYASKGDKLMRSVVNTSDAQQFKINTVIPFSAFNRQLTGQVQAIVAYVKYYNFKNGYQPPKGRKGHSWNHGYSFNINYDNDRVDVSLYGSISPKGTYQANYMKWNTNFTIEAYYSLLKKRNLILGLGIYNLLSHSSFSRSYFPDGFYSQTSKYMGPTVQLSIKFRLNKGQKVVEEYREYTPNDGRLR